MKPQKQAHQSEAIIGDVLHDANLKLNSALMNGEGEDTTCIVWVRLDHDPRIRVGYGHVGVNDVLHVHSRIRCTGT
jgi:hypothetical protein